MKRSIVLGALLTCVLTGSAMAADMPTRALPAARAACAHFGGFYVGGQAGVSNYNHTFNNLDSSELINTRVALTKAKTNFNVSI
jgi:hypothetical protein